MLSLHAEVFLTTYPLRSSRIALVCKRSGSSAVAVPRYRFRSGIYSVMRPTPDLFSAAH